MLRNEIQNREALLCMNAHRTATNTAAARAARGFPNVLHARLFLHCHDHKVLHAVGRQRHSGRLHKVLWIWRVTWGGVCIKKTTKRCVTFFSCKTTTTKAFESVLAKSEKKYFAIVSSVGKKTTIELTVKGWRFARSSNCFAFPFCSKCAFSARVSLLVAHSRHCAWLHISHFLFSEPLKLHQGRNQLIFSWMGGAKWLQLVVVLFSEEAKWL